MDCNTTPKKAPRSPSKIPTKSGKPINMPEPPSIKNFNNPSLTQDINEIIRREEEETVKNAVNLDILPEGDEKTQQSKKEESKGVTVPEFDINGNVDIGRVRKE